jgi:hypothetical protein
MDKLQMNRELTELVNLANGYGENKIMYVEEHEFRDALLALYENNYFEDIAYKMFENLCKSNVMGSLNVTAIKAKA